VQIVGRADDEDYVAALEVLKGMGKEEPTSGDEEEQAEATAGEEEQAPATAEEEEKVAATAAVETKKPAPPVFSWETHKFGKKLVVTAGRGYKNPSAGEKAVVTIEKIGDGASGDGAAQPELTLIVGDCTAEGNLLTMAFGAQLSVRGLHDALMTMKRGEAAEIVVTPPVDADSTDTKEVPAEEVHLLVTLLAFQERSDVSKDGGVVKWLLQVQSINSKDGGVVKWLLQVQSINSILCTNYGCCRRAKGINCLLSSPR
jgi:hypothetical protein